jgi:hypothetical protein
MEANLEGFKLALKVLGVAPRLYEHVKVWKGGPTKEDSERLVRYCRRLDERRVFSAPYHMELAQSCVGSISEVRQYTDEALADIKHPVARAAIGAILDEVRRFEDKWHGYQSSADWHPHRFGGRFERTSDRDFFQDLGGLRDKMKVFVGMITELVPDATAPKLFGPDDEP